MRKWELIKSKSPSKSNRHLSHHQTPLGLKLLLFPMILGRRIQLITLNACLCCLKYESQQALQPRLDARGRIPSILLVSCGARSPRCGGPTSSPWARPQSQLEKVVSSNSESCPPLGPSVLSLTLIVHTLSLYLSLVSGPRCQV